MDGAATVGINVKVVCVQSAEAGSITDPNEYTLVSSET
jgi:hypothetical protein